MTKKPIITLFTLVICSLISSSFLTTSVPKEPMVLIQTTEGNIKLKLYNETPLHRDNFLKLVKQHTYDSCLFHRVIQGFMIQSGDPESKKAKPGDMLGNGNVGYTLPAEINPKFYHKRGALAAARMGDDINPKRESSGCQFYIVHGKPFTAADLDMFENQQNQMLLGQVQGKKQQIFEKIINDPANQALRDKFIRFQQGGVQDSLQALIQNVVEPMINKEFVAPAPFHFSPEQRKDYTTIGGAPHLDGAYTVFGEVTEGMQIVDKIANAPKDAMDRPLTDIRIIKVKVIK